VKEKVFLRVGKGRITPEGALSRELKPKDGFMKDIVIQEFEEGRLRRISLADEGMWAEANGG
jgi:hypothetical protein